MRWPLTRSAPLCGGGYDLTAIASISEWDSEVAGQDFTIENSLVGSASFTSLGRFTYAADDVSFEVALSEDTTGILASGVDAVRFVAAIRVGTAGKGKLSEKRWRRSMTPATVPPAHSLFHAHRLRVQHLVLRPGHLSADRITSRDACHAHD